MTRHPIAILAASLCLIPAVMAPLPSHASELSSAFLTSSTGSTTIELGDTIQFEVSVTADLSQDFDTILWSITGDATAAVTSTQNSGWAGVSNLATDWTWYYTSSNPLPGSKVKMGTNGRFSPASPPIAPPSPVAGHLGFFAQDKIGDGVPALVGTLTVTANAPGSFEGGGFLMPNIDGFVLDGVLEPATVQTVSYTVAAPIAVPIGPGLGALLVGGLLLAGGIQIRRLRLDRSAQRSRAEEERS